MKFSAAFFLTKTIVILTCLSRSVLIPFFPLYLKYLNMTLIQMGIIRSLQIWTALLFTTLSFKTGKLLSNNTIKQVSISASIFTTITLCICLLFLPPYKFTKNVTHCFNNESPDLQDIYNLHFTKIVHPLMQNISNETFSDNSEHAASTKMAAHYNDFEEASEQKIVEKTENEGEKANNNPKVNYFNQNELTDNDVKFISQKNKTPNSRKTNLLRSSNFMENNFPYTYGITKENFIQKYKVNSEETQRNSFKTEDAEEDAKSLQSTTSSVLNAFLQTSHKFSLLTHHQKPNDEIISHDTIHFGQNSKLNSKMKTRFKNMYYSTHKEERNIPAFNNRNLLDEINLHSKRTKFEKYRKHTNNEKLENNEDSTLNQNINSHSEWDDTYRRQDSSISANGQENYFRKKRNTASRNMGRNNNKTFPIQLISENITSVLQTSEVENQNFFYLMNWQHMWSETFLYAVVLTVLYEVFSSQIVPWTETLCSHNSDEFLYDDHLLSSQIFIPKSHLWLISYPIVAVLATLSLCPYQIALHCFIAAMLLVFAFLAALLLLTIHYSKAKQFRNRKLSKPIASEKHFMESSIQRFFTSITNMLIGICTACYMECILWNVEMLKGFPFNYEYLYCGYYFLNTLACLVTSRYLHYRRNSATVFNIESDSEEEEENIHFSYDWIMKNKEIVYVEEQKLNIVTVVGTFLLSLILLVIPFFTHAWTLLPLALLKGIFDAYLEITVTYGYWSKLLVGYGIGCFLGSAVASVFGMEILFFSVSSVMLLCSFIWLCYSIYLRYFKGPYTRISLEGQNYGSSNSESHQQNEDEVEEDWLEKALQQDMFNQSKNMLKS